MSKGIKLTRVQREQVSAAEDVFRPWGLRTEVSMGGEHARMWVYDPNGKRWALTIVCSPKSRSSAGSHTRQAAQRLLRQINDALGVTRL